MERTPAALAKFLQVTPGLRRQATEFLRSRGLLTYAKEEFKVRALALLLREAGTARAFNVSDLTGLHPVAFQSVSKPLEMLAGAKVLVALSDRKYSLNLAAPVEANYYQGKTARFLRLTPDMKVPKLGASVPKYRVLRVWKDLADRWFVTFVPHGADGPTDVVSLSEAFLSFGKLRREVTP